MFGPSTSAGTLEGLLTRHGLPPTVWTKAQTVGVTTIALFGSAWGDEKEMMQMFGDTIPDVKDNLGRRGAIRLAWRQAVMMVDRDLKKSIDGGDMVDLEAPLPADEDATLDDKWRRHISLGGGVVDAAISRRIFQGYVYSEVYPAMCLRRGF